VTWYGRDGEVLRSQRAEFELSRSGKVRIFTFSNIEVLEGPGKGQKASTSGSYIYRVQNDLFVEVGGLLIDERYADRSPYLLKWKKVKNPGE
jgi:hypothetical protein